MPTQEKQPNSLEDRDYKIGNHGQPANWNYRETGFWEVMPNAFLPTLQ
jgi:hypothetical protein